MSEGAELVNGCGVGRGVVTGEVGTSGGIDRLSKSKVWLRSVSSYVCLTRIACWPLATVGPPPVALESLISVEELLGWLHSLLQGR